MRYFIVIMALIISFASCDSTQSAMKDEPVSKEINNDTLRIANDSLEYEIIIIEPGFYNWLVTQFPEEYYSMSFLKNRNIFFVTEYNRRVIDPITYDPDLYPLQIDYDQHVDYGKEVNYLLYNYFVYFQRTYNQKLL